MKESKDHRCGCGQLMAKQTEEGLEIKCKRCKQVYFIPMTQSGAKEAQTV
jgi:phage FluMu protein Com